MSYQSTFTTVNIDFEMEVLFLYYNSFENSFREFYLLLPFVRFTFFFINECTLHPLVR